MCAPAQRWYGRQDSKIDCLSSDTKSFQRVQVLCTLDTEVLFGGISSTATVSSDGWINFLCQSFVKLYNLIIRAVRVQRFRWFQGKVQAYFRENDSVQQKLKLNKNKYWQILCTYIFVFCNAIMFKLIIKVLAKMTAQKRII